MIKSVRLTSKYLNKNKLQSIKNIDIDVMLLKNQISEFIHSNILELINLGNLKFGNKYYKQYTNVLTAWETQKLFNQVCIFYLNSVDRYYKNNKFEIQKEFKVTYYKKKTKKHKVGDVKYRVLYKKKSSLNKLLKYLMYITDFNNIYNEEIKSILNNYTDNKKNKIINYIKFKQQYIIDKINIINFKNGTYIKDGFQRSSKTKDSIFIDKTNKKYNYWYAYKIKNKFIYIPLEINEKYHKNFNTNKCHYIQIKNNKVNILTTKDELSPVFNNKYNIIGVDINVVNNFMSCSNKYIVNYDKKYLAKMFKLVKKIDIVGYNNLSKNKTKQLNKIVKQNEWYFQKIISEFLDYCENNNIYDIAIENLNLAGKTFIRDKETNIKYSRIIKLLRLSNIKNWLLSQAEKRGIKIHITTSNYTPQMCPKCGYIDRENRKTQEDFECINCGHIDNADHNASINIKNRFSLDVLKNSQLHKFDKYGRMVPNLSNKYFIKNLLENIYVIDT